MKPVARALIRLYPANWRARYGDEFAALLEDSPPTRSGMFDLLKGAIKMQLKIPAFPKLALILSAAGLLAGLGVSFVVTPRYISQAVLTFDATSTPKDSRRNLNEYFVQLENEILSRTSLSAIIQDPRLDLYRRERVRTPLEDVIEKMRTEDIQIGTATPGSVNRESLAVQISFGYSDRIKAQQTVQALITKFQDLNLTRQRVAAYTKRGRTYDDVDRMEQRIAVLEKRLGIQSPAPGPLDFPAAPVEGTNLDVLDPPGLPVYPVYPNRYTFMLTGFGAGFISALVVAVFRRRLPPIPFPAQTA